MAAAVAFRHRRLVLAFVVIRRASEADVEVFGMAPPRPHFCEPAAIRSGFAAHRLLDRGIDRKCG